METKDTFKNMFQEEPLFDLPAKSEYRDQCKRVDHAGFAVTRNLIKKYEKLRIGTASWACFESIGLSCYARWEDDGYTTPHKYIYVSVVDIDKSSDEQIQTHLTEILERYVLSIRSRDKEIQVDQKLFLLESELKEHNFNSEFYCTEQSNKDLEQVNRLISSIVCTINKEHSKHNQKYIYPYSYSSYACVSGIKYNIGFGKLDKTKSKYLGDPLNIIDSYYIPKEVYRDSTKLEKLKDQLTLQLKTRCSELYKTAFNSPVTENVTTTTETTQMDTSNRQYFVEEVDIKTLGKPLTHTVSNYRLTPNFDDHLQWAINEAESVYLDINIKVTDQVIYKNHFRATLKIINRVNNKQYPINTFISHTDFAQAYKDKQVNQTFLNFIANMIMKYKIIDNSSVATTDTTSTSTPEQTCTDFELLKWNPKYTAPFQGQGNDQVNLNRLERLVTDKCNVEMYHYRGYRFLPFGFTAHLGHLSFGLFVMRTADNSCAYSNSYMMDRSKFALTNDTTFRQVFHQKLETEFGKSHFKSDEATDYENKLFKAKADAYLKELNNQQLQDLKKELVDNQQANNNLAEALLKQINKLKEDVNLLIAESNNQKCDQQEAKITSNQKKESQAMSAEIKMMTDITTSDPIVTTDPGTLKFNISTKPEHQSNCYKLRSIVEDALNCYACSDSELDFITYGYNTYNSHTSFTIQCRVNKVRNNSIYYIKNEYLADNTTINRSSSYNAIRSTLINVFSILVQETKTKASDNKIKAEAQPTTTTKTTEPKPDPVKHADYDPKAELFLEKATTNFVDKQEGAERDFAIYKLKPPLEDIVNSYKLVYRKFELVVSQFYAYRDHIGFYLTINTTHDQKSVFSKLYYVDLKYLTNPNYTYQVYRIQFAELVANQLKTLNDSLATVSTSTDNQPKQEQPTMKSHYLLHLVYQIQYLDGKPQTDFPVKEDLVLVEVDPNSNQDLFQLGDKIGKLRLERYYGTYNKNFQWKNRPARWIFVNCRNTSPCHELPVFATENNQQQLSEGVFLTEYQLEFNSLKLYKAYQNCEQSIAKLDDNYEDNINPKMISVQTESLNKFESEQVTINNNDNNDEDETDIDTEDPYSRFPDDIKSVVKRLVDNKQLQESDLNQILVYKIFHPETSTLRACYNYQIYKHGVLLFNKVSVL